MVAASSGGVARWLDQSGTASQHEQLVVEQLDELAWLERLV